MAGEWQTTQLGSVARINPDVIAADWPYSHIQYIDISSVGVGQIQTPPLRLELSVVPSRAKRLVRAGDTVISTVRPNGRSMFYASEPADDWVVSTGFAVLRPDEQFIHPRFLYACVFNQAFTEYLITREKGAAYPAISAEDIAKAEIPYPPLKEQHAIACILGALDDKIELNRRMNETLEQIAQAIFKEWFIEPTKDGLPEGWREGTLGEVADNLRRTIQPEQIEPDTPYIALEHMPRRSIALSDWGLADGLESNKFEFKQGEILFGKLRPYFHKVGVAPFDGVCSTDILVVSPINSNWFGFLLGHLSSTELVEYTNASSTGTKMPRTNWGDMARYKLALPPESLAGSFTKTISPAVERIISNIRQSHTLAALRDTLLPKLISGELRVPDAEKICARGASAFDGVARCV